jgi:hypothetical protein
MSLTLRVGLISRRSQALEDWPIIQSQYAAPVFAHTGEHEDKRAFLAEKTEAVANKLDVQGGVIAKYKVGPDRTAQFDIVVLTQGDDSGADRLIVIEVSPPDLGEPLHAPRVAYEPN